MQRKRKVQVGMQLTREVFLGSLEEYAYGGPDSTRPIWMVGGSL